MSVLSDRVPAAETLRKAAPLFRRRVPATRPLVASPNNGDAPTHEPALYRYDLHRDHAADHSDIKQVHELVRPRCLDWRRAAGWPARAAEKAGQLYEAFPRLALDRKVQTWGRVRAKALQ